MSIKKKVIRNTVEYDQQANIKTLKTSDFEIIKHVLTGMSYMVPILVLFSIVRAFEQIIPMLTLGVTTTEEAISLLNSEGNTKFMLAIINITYLLQQFRNILFQIATPIFAGFTANSIGGKTALILGIVGGFIANNPITTLVYNNQSVDVIKLTPSGFLGALIISLIIGYAVKYLNEKIKVDRKNISLKVHLIVPTIGLIICILLMIFVINPTIAYVGEFVRAALENTKYYNEYIYSILMAIATTFDLGGPINKVSGVVCMGLYMDGIFPVTARTLAVVIPSIGLGLSTIIDEKLIGKKVFDSRLYSSGKNALWLGIMGISEGGLPFALEMPYFVIPTNIIGTIIGVLVAVSMGAVQTFPESAIWAWPFAENFLAYLAGIAAGSIFIALSNILYRNRLLKLNKVK